MIIIHFNIIFFLLVTSAYFVYIIISDKTLTDIFTTNSAYLAMISLRSSNFNNMLIFYRETIATITQKSDVDSSQFSLISSNNTLNNLDLFNLYYNKTISIERNINLIPQNSYFFSNFLTESQKLNSKNFCTNIEQNTEFYQKTKACTINIGLKDMMEIVYIDLKSSITDYNNEKNKDFNYILSKLKDSKLEKTIELAESYFNPSLLIEINAQFLVIDDIITNYKSQSIIITSAFFVFSILLFIIFYFISNYLTYIINKNKAILMIIPNEVIINNLNIQASLQFLTNYS